MEQIAAGAEEASGASEQIRASVVQIEKGSARIAQNAKQNLEKVKSIKNLIEDTSSQIELLIEGVHNASEAALETSKLMEELEKQSEEIGNIVQAVVRIAEQTKLLALNATIEAARAGEHGRGFAVVADEVRKLADYTNQFVKEIKERILEFQENIKNFEKLYNIFAKETIVTLKRLGLIQNMATELMNTIIVMKDEQKDFMVKHTNIYENINQIIVNLQFEDITKQMNQHILNIIEKMNQEIEEIHIEEFKDELLEIGVKEEIIKELENHF